MIEQKPEIKAEYLNENTVQWVEITWPEISKGMLVRLWDLDGNPIEYTQNKEYRISKDSYLNENGIWTFQYELDEPQ